ncbi:hypothetical protein [Nonomuraea sp. NPDC049758]|uniref:hypothetical protein n=1 Tax=Nonomuraea sp. NPDC049758 TaxID=3154360 RepID=UPI003444848D
MVNGRTAVLGSGGLVVLIRGRPGPKALEGAAVQPRSPARDRRPWVSSWDGDPHHDVNPACGHHLRALCGGCGVCTTCDGCYCTELSREAAIDAATP